MAIGIPRLSRLALHGEMVWGLRQHVAGSQWKEPFAAVVRMSATKGQLDSYTLGFGDDKPLEEKSVPSGLYRAVLSETEAEPRNTGHDQVVAERPEKGAYKFVFSKPTAR